MPINFPEPGVYLQVLQERGETGSRHGRATFAVLLLQASASCSCSFSILPRRVISAVQAALAAGPCMELVMLT